MAVSGGSPKGTHGHSREEGQGTLCVTDNVTLCKQRHNDAPLIANQLLLIRARLLCSRRLWGDGLGVCDRRREGVTVGEVRK